MQSLSITQPQAEILTLLERSEVRNTEILHRTGLPAGTVGVTLTRMVDKGWLQVSVDELDHFTPLTATTAYYSLSELGRRALAAWRVYTEQ